MIPGNIYAIDIDPKIAPFLNIDPQKPPRIPIQLDPATNRLIPAANIEVDPTSFDINTVPSITARLSDTEMFKNLIKNPEVGITLKSSDLVFPVHVNINGVRTRLGPRGDGNFTIKLLDGRKESGSLMYATILDENGNIIATTDKIGKGHLPRAARTPQNHYLTRHTLDLVVADEVLRTLPPEMRPFITNIPEIAGQTFKPLYAGQAMEIDGVVVDPKITFSKNGYRMLIAETNLQGYPTGYVVLTESGAPDAAKKYNYGFMTDVLNEALTGTDTGSSEFSALQFVMQNVEEAAGKNKAFEVNILGDSPTRFIDIDSVRAYLNQMFNEKYPVSNRIYDQINFKGGRFLGVIDLIDTIRLGLVMKLLRDTNVNNPVNAIIDSIGMQGSEIVGSPEDGTLTFVAEEALTKHQGGQTAVVYHSNLGAELSTQLEIPHVFVVNSPEKILNIDSMSPTVHLVDEIPEGYEVATYNIINGISVDITPLENEPLQIPVSDIDMTEMSSATFATMCNMYLEGSLNEMPEGINITHRVYSKDAYSRFHIFTMVQEVNINGTKKHNVYSYYKRDNRIIT